MHLFMSDSSGLSLSSFFLAPQSIFSSLPRKSNTQAGVYIASCTLTHVSNNTERGISASMDCRHLHCNEAPLSLLYWCCRIFHCYLRDCIYNYFFYLEGKYKRICFCEMSFCFIYHLIKNEPKRELTCAH